MDQVSWLLCSIVAHCSFIRQDLAGTYKNGIFRFYSCRGGRQVPGSVAEAFSKGVGD